MFPAPHITLLASSSGGLVVVALLGAIAGFYLFYKGFRLLRFKRLILNTPLSRIHSASIGLVEVNGTPIGPYVLKAPITGDPCYYYHVKAYQWVESGNNNQHQWKCVLDESLFVPFFLEDTTGRVLVNPQGAQMDVHRSFADEVDAAIFRMPGVCPPNVRDFLARRGLVPAEKIKLEERIIPQMFPLFVFGTLGENPDNSFAARPPSKVQWDTRVDISLGAFGNLSSATATVPASARATSATPSADKSNFGPFEARPSVAISKGERHEPFAISGHSQKELVGKLAWQSTACIWGGPLLALACLYFLVVYAQATF